MIGRLHVVEFALIIIGLYWVLKKEEESFTGFKVVAYWVITVGMGVWTVVRNGGLS